MDSAYGGKVDPDAHEAALPARLLNTRRSIRVTHSASGRSVVCRVNDVGPWNISDRYWDADARPLAEAQFATHTPAQNGQIPANKAGIDLTPAVFDALGIRGPINTRQTIVDWCFV